MKIACISDTHGLYLPTVDPDTDVIIHAGDVGPDKNPAYWLKTSFSAWAMDFGKPIHLTWGNHDFIGRKKSDIDALILPPNVHFHVDELVDIGGLNVWFSPWSPAFGTWAFMEPETQLAARYENIPVFTDVIVSHTPPFGYRDYTLYYGQKHVGSTSLLNHIRNSNRIRYVICGHIHEGKGRERMRDSITEIINCAQVDVDYEPVENGVEYIEW